MQFEISSTSEWLLIVPFTNAIYPKLCEKTCYSLLLIINLAKLTVYTGKGMSKYSQVYGIQVYSTLYSLQQIVVTYKFTSL